MIKIFFQYTYDSALDVKSIWNLFLWWWIYLYDQHFYDDIDFFPHINWNIYLIVHLLSIYLKGHIYELVRLLSALTRLLHFFSGWQGGLHAAVHGVTKSRTRLSKWTELNWIGYSPLLFLSSILDTFRPGGLIFWCHTFFTFHTVHEVLTASILEWSAISSSSWSRFVRTLCYDPSV